MHLSRPLLPLFCGSAFLLPFSPTPVLGQIIPDETLGEERSQVFENFNGTPNDVIGGGALRGPNLFHSFSEFNIDEGQRVYFSNPIAVEHIFSRVTGANPSNIFGTLGVDGPADLFFMNPNGILFGENASLDIEGAFVGTTASSFRFADGSEFGAVPAVEGDLLTVSVPLGLQYGPTPPGSTITSRGTLQTGDDFELRGDRLDLQGQLFSGGDLTLLGTDSVQIRDAVDNPFIAASVGKMVVQGDRLVDIFALSHPDSGLYSGGNMTLRSANPVGGDAHYWSGGTFQIEQLDGSLGNLLSPYDPIIRSLGDVNIFSYQGTSLHIIAGGQVTIQSVAITGPDVLGEVISPLTTPELSNIEFSNGRQQSVDGTGQAVLDIRAGMDPNAIGLPLGTLGATPVIDRFLDTSLIPTFPPIGGTTISGTGIRIGDVFIAIPEGLVILTNQHEPNLALPSGNIVLSGEGILGTGGVNVQGLDGKGGTVIFDSRGEIILDGAIISAASVPFNIPTVSGDGGEILLLSQEDIIFNPSSQLVADGLMGGDITLDSQGEINLTGSILQSLNLGNDLGNPTDLGNITINASALSLETFGANTVTFGQQDAGNITIDVSGAVNLRGPLELRSDNFAQGNAGNITIDSGSLSIVGEDITISASTLGDGNAGDIEIKASGTIDIDGADFFSNVETGASGDSGSISIDAQSLGLGNGTQLQTRLRGMSQNEAQEIFINVDDDITINGSSFIFTTVTTGGTGNANNIRIRAGGDLRLDNRAFIDSTLEPGATGKSGDITINAESLFLVNDSQIAASTDGRGDAGSITITVTESISGRSGGIIRSDTFGQGNAGNIKITAGNAIVFDGPGIDNPNSGIFSFVGTDSQAGLFGNGDGGAIDIDARSLSLTNGANINTRVDAKGNAGAIDIDVIDVIEIAGSDTQASGISSAVVNGAEGSAGPIDIDVTSGSLSMNNLALITTSIDGNGRDGNESAANINIFVQDSISLENFSNIRSNVGQGGEGNAGTVRINAETVSVLSGSGINTGIFPARDRLPGGKGLAGDLIITATDSLTVSGANLDQFSIGLPTIAISNISTSTGAGATGPAGDLIITETGNITISDGGIIDTRTVNADDAGQILIDAESLTVTGGGQLISLTDNAGNAGNIELNIAGDISLSGSNDSFEEFSAALGEDLRNQGANSGIFANVTQNSSGEGSELTINAQNLELLDRAQITFSTAGQGDAGQITITASESIALRNNSSISNAVQQGATGDADRILFQTPDLSLRNNSQISSSTNGTGNPGIIRIRDAEGNADRITLNNSSITTAVQGKAEAEEPGNINLQTDRLRLTNESAIRATTGGEGDAGIIRIPVVDRITLDNSSISTAVLTGATNSDSGTIRIGARSLSLTNDSNITASTNSNGSAGRIRIQDADDITLDNSQISTVIRVNGRVKENADEQQFSTISISTALLELSNSAQISSSTAGQRDAGRINIDAIDAIRLVQGSRINTDVRSNATGNAERIRLNTPLLFLRNDSRISAATNGDGDPGSIQVEDANRIVVSNSDISTTVGAEARLINLLKFDRIYSCTFLSLF